MSATSVRDLANGGDSYRECLELIKDDVDLDNEFVGLFGISAENAIRLIEHRILNEAILDVVVQNSLRVDVMFN
jgi:hypothetical protein